MKKVMLIMVSMLLFVATANAELTGWLLGVPAYDTEKFEQGIVRAGYLADSGLETGLSSTWWKDVELDQAFGLYTILHMAEESVGGKTIQPYIGSEFCLKVFDGDNADYVQPIAGCVIDEILVIEYGYRIMADEFAKDMNDQHEFRIGFRLKF
jgi:hypothetical protein